MTSQVVQGTWLDKGGYGRFRGQCVKMCYQDNIRVLMKFIQYVYIRLHCVILKEVTVKVFLTFYLPETANHNKVSK